MENQVKVMEKHWWQSVWTLIIALPWYRVIFQAEYIEHISVAVFFSNTYSGHFFKPQLESWVGDAFFPSPLAEELSCAVSQRVLHVPVTALHWRSGSQQPANCWTVCDCVGVCMCVSMLPSEHFVASALRCQWHIERVRWESPAFPRAVFTPSVYSPETLSNLLLLFLSHSLFFPPSMYLPYLLLTCLDLSFQISSCVVVRWFSCRQPALVSPSAGGGIEFRSQSASQLSFCLKNRNTLFSWMEIFDSVLLINKIVVWESVGRIQLPVCKMQRKQ